MTDSTLTKGSTTTVHGIRYGELVTITAGSGIEILILQKLQLHYYKMGTGSVTWLLRNQIGELS